MTTLLAEQSKKLIDSISRWCTSQNRIKIEEANQAVIAATLREELNIDPEDFRRLAEAVWAEDVAKYRQSAESQLALLELSLINAKQSEDLCESRAEHRAPWAMQ